MGSSLDRLTNNLPAEAFKYTSEVFQGEKLTLMTKEGVYPYDYLDSFEKFTKKNMHFRTTCTSDRTSVIVGRPLRKLQEGMHAWRTTSWIHATTRFWGCLGMLCEDDKNGARANERH